MVVTSGSAKTAGPGPGASRIFTTSSVRVDANRAPGNTASTADAAGHAELVLPAGELVRQPLPVAGGNRLPHRTTVDV